MKAGIRRAAAVAVAALGVFAPAASAGGDGVNGPPGVGDPLFPKSGNGFYDVSDYDLRLNYSPAHGSAARGGKDQGDRGDARPTPPSLQPRLPRAEDQVARGRRAPRRSAPQRPGADHHAEAAAGERRGVPGQGALRREAEAADRSGRRQGGLDEDPGRRDRPRGAAWLTSLVPVQRPPDRQGRLPDPDHHAPARNRHLERAPDEPASQRSQGDDDVGGVEYGHLPHDRRDRPLPARRWIRGRGRVSGGHRSQVRAQAGNAAEAAQPSRSHIPAERRGALPLRCDRRRCRPVERRLRAGNAGPSVLPGAAVSGPGRPRAGPPVVRQLAFAGGVGRDLAERGLRDLHGVAL